MKMGIYLNRVNEEDLDCLQMKKRHHYYSLMEHVAVAAEDDGMNRFHPS